MRIVLAKGNIFDFKYRFTVEFDCYGFIATKYHGAYKLDNRKWIGYSTLNNTSTEPNKNKTFFI